jgi:ureidoacrylate peracid hydrolase
MQAAREAGVPVYLVQNQHSAESDTEAWLNRHPNPSRAQSCQVGSWGADFCGFEPQTGDHVVPKTRYSAFINTTLADDLRAAGRTSLLFAGVTTATCVESSLRDAVCLDFLATLVEDCCGAYDEESHRRGVRAVTAGFGEVRSLDEVIAHWQTGETEGNVA